MQFNLNRSKSIIASLLSIYLLSGCDNLSEMDIFDTDDDTPSGNTFDRQVKGVVTYHDVVVGAEVCVDINQNQVCESDEPTAITDSQGAYQIDWVSNTEVFEYQLIASWTQASAAALTPGKFTFSGAAKQSLTANKISAMPVVNTDGEATLFARQAHEGAINYFTNLEHRRYLEMVAQDLSDAQVEALLVKLETTLKALIGEVEGNVYLIANEEYVLSRTVIIEQLIDYLELIFTDIAFETLVVEELLANIFTQLTDLIDGSEMSTLEYLASNSIEASFLINNSLTMLGYIDNPYDDRIMSESDWQVIENNFFSDAESLSHTVGLSITPSLSFATLADESKMLFGTLSADGFNHVTFDFEQENEAGEVLEECWNQTTQSWDFDDGTSPVVPIAPYQYENNTRSAQFMVDDAMVNFTFSKVDTQSTYWASVLAATPPELALADVSWPNVVYTFSAEQDIDVMCRVKDDYMTYALETMISDIQQLTTAIVAKSLLPFEDPTDLMINEVDQTFYNPANEASYSWSLITGPNESDIVKVDEVILQPALQAFTNPDFYKVELGMATNQLEEVSLYQTADWSQSYPEFIYSYDNSDGFTETLFEHLKSL
ncbi:hypothetical protein [Shewanella maritima]|uniref:hypothetical protein n=1 Tax=Shewanella maritima TaxID=2520507 RepID=UPI0037361956